MFVARCLGRDLSKRDSGSRRRSKTAFCCPVSLQKSRDHTFMTASLSLMYSGVKFQESILHSYITMRAYNITFN